MNLTEWNARLHGLVIFRALLDDDVIAKFVDLTDRMAAAPQSTGAVCDAAASFEAALFEHTTNFGKYLSAAEKYLIQLVRQTHNAPCDPQ